MEFDCKMNHPTICKLKSRFRKFVPARWDGKYLLKTNKWVYIPSEDICVLYPFYEYINLKFDKLRDGNNRIELLTCKQDGNELVDKRRYMTTTLDKIVLYKTVKL